MATYKQETVDKEGKKKELTFTADHELKIDRYLKIDNKGVHVETYQEFPEDEVPQKDYNK
ncbi:YxeA family protein [Enterococcus caccae]|uniref:YxeA family protein n=1 Tax=Enterococcus caccae TaxID=317735 RepID=UPI0036F2312B